MLSQREIVRFKVLIAIEENPNVTQRELSKILGVSLGSINFCIKAFIDKGILKVKNFSNSDNKKSYIYCLTPFGIIEKTKITSRYLYIKRQEYLMLKKEIELIQSQLNKSDINL